MTTTIAGLRTAMLVCVLFVVSTQITNGQSTIFNAPSTDIVLAQRIYVEADFITHPNAYEKGGYQLYGLRTVYGLRNKMEVGINIYHTRSSDSPEPVVVEPNFKWQFYNDEGKGLSAAAGVLVSIPVSHRSAGRTSGVLYAVASKQFKGDLGPRITAGSYVLADRCSQKTSKYGALVGYEQPLNDRFNFVADWTTGNNELGYVAAGIGVRVSSNSSLYVGYNVGNQGRGNNALGIYYGFAF
jgi:hypothetical protein